MCYKRLLEVWEHGRAIMQESGIEGETETERMEVSTRWPDGVGRICGRWRERLIATPHRGQMALREGARAERLGSPLQGAKEEHLHRRARCAVGLGTRFNHYTSTYQASRTLPFGHQRAAD
jgi:hypothetical protein